MGKTTAFVNSFEVDELVIWVDVMTTFVFPEGRCPTLKSHRELRRARGFKR